LLGVKSHQELLYLGFKEYKTPNEKLKRADKYFPPANAGQNFK
jgi:hypothetical protein